MMMMTYRGQNQFFLHCFYIISCLRDFFKFKTKSNKEYLIEKDYNPRHPKYLQLLEFRGIKSQSIVILNLISSAVIRSTSESTQNP